MLHIDFHFSEGTFLVSPTSVLRLDPKEGTEGVFICYDGKEEVTIRLEARGKGLLFQCDDDLIASEMAFHLIRWCR